MSAGVHVTQRAHREHNLTAPRKKKSHFKKNPVLFSRSLRFVVFQTTGKKSDRWVEEEEKVRAESPFFFCVCFSLCGRKRAICRWIGGERETALYRSEEDEEEEEEL